MYIGTTPTHTFILPFDAEMVDSIIVTYAQVLKKREDPTIILNKTKSDITFSGQSISLTLSQEETRQFSPGNALVQIRVLDTEGKVYTSKQHIIAVKPVLNDDIIYPEN